MSRISDTFARLAASGRKALVPFVTAGHPARECTPDILRELARNGADVIELGVPFSDPMADGPAIQRSNECALAQKVGLRDVFGWVREFRRDDDETPIVLMGYANPVERMGVETFLDEAAAAGVDGLIVVDYPPEESEAFAQAARARGIDPIFLLAPTSTEDRIGQVLSLASGYVYYVSLKGITGGTLDRDDVRRRVAAIKARTALPIGVGFGIRDAETACAVAESADAVIIGTKLIQVLEDGTPDQAARRVGEFLGSIRSALDERYAAKAGA
ncbi:tryptophan synthase subunit alpha [Burkholderiaceae bacterium FT117]|uniref:tryptophan synthase subunit alpha n=1 Tax=Zeimonas sediminis TaxID=2944268 RepID=UPI002342DE16|nr:tryptophan synthase subunit alpha [Zeimonas sediminis]MCM5569544.1 tryptophan synthase subunit alpha [Zeimonas sediminis]